jgi:hypothetical protein
MTRQRIATAVAASLLLSLTSAAARAVDGPIAVSTTHIDFGQVNVGSTSSASVTLTNTGGSPFGPINMFGGAPPTAEYGASQNCQGQTLPAGGSCNVDYAFMPGAGGAFQDSSNFTISETGSQADGEDFSILLTGTGRSLCLRCDVAVFPPFPGIIANPDETPDRGETPDPGETPPTFDHELTGTAKVKGKGLKASQPYTLQLSFDPAAGTFLAMAADGAVYTGNLVAKGKRGDKFRLFLDDATEGALAADVAGRAAIASGRAAGALLGETSKLTLKLGRNGELALRLKSEVLTSGIGEVVLKANLTSTPAAQ